MKAWYLIAVASLSLAQTGWAQTADLAVVHARIYTLDPRQPHASALAVRQGVIVSVSGGVARFISPSTNMIDAHGATVLPGLIDSHGHIHGLGDALEELDLRGLERSFQERVICEKGERRG